MQIYGTKSVCHAVYGALKKDPTVYVYWGLCVMEKIANVIKMFIAQMQKKPFFIFCLALYIFSVNYDKNILDQNMTE